MSQQSSSEEAVRQTIYEYYEAGRTKDFQILQGMKARLKYTKFDDTPPYSRQDAEEASLYEELNFASISDFNYKIEDRRIDVMGEIAVATFYLSAEGMLVDDYSFRGAKVARRSRVSMVLKREQGEWRIAHHHSSAFPVEPV